MCFETRLPRPVSVPEKGHPHLYTFYGKSVHGNSNVGLYGLPVPGNALLRSSIGIYYFNFSQFLTE